LPDVRNKSVLGTFFHAPVRGAVEILEDALVEVDGNGTIGAVLRPPDADYAARKSGAGRSGALVSLAPGCFGLPGFVDLHLHAPQYPQLGAALHVPLEIWLQEYTFPLEARYADVAFAERAYNAPIGDILALGTTTAVLFARTPRGFWSTSASGAGSAHWSARWRWTTPKVAPTTIAMRRLPRP
jgi:guanine deaminase